MTAKAQAPTISAFQDFGASVKITEPATPKRHRKPQMVAVNPKPKVSARRASPKPPRRRGTPTKIRRLTATEQRLGRYLVIALGAVVTIMLGVSLEHLASGIREITHSAVWSAWALAIAIDVGMVASEVALIVLATFPNIRVADYAYRYVVSTIVISVALNIWAFWPADSEGAWTAMTLAVVLGAGIPLGVYHLTRVAGRIWLATTDRIEAT